MVTPRRRPASVLAALAILLGGAIAPAPAYAQSDDPIAVVREEAEALVREQRYYAALRLLRAVDLASLPADRALALKGWIADLDAKRAGRLRQDLADAEALALAGDREGSRAVLDGVAHYGAPEDMAEARRVRLVIDADEAREQAEAEAARAEAEAEAERARAKEAAARERALAEVGRLTGRWLEQRERLLCTGCRGSRERRCGACGGAGRERVINVFGGGSTWVDCRPCSATGKQRCSPCTGLGLATVRFESILYAPLAPAARRALGTKSRFQRHTIAALHDQGEEPAVDAHVAQMRWALSLVLGKSELAVSLDAEAGRATARYAVAVPDGQRQERLVWVRAGEGDWHLDPAASGVIPGR